MSRWWWSSAPGPVGEIEALLRFLDRCRYWFEWSPDSRFLAVVHTVTSKRVLSIVDVNNGTLRTLDVGGRPVDNAVYWRPGTTSEIIFTSHSQPGNSARAGIFSNSRPRAGSRLAIVPVVIGPAEYNGVDLAPDGRTLTRVLALGSGVRCRLPDSPAPVRRVRPSGARSTPLSSDRADEPPARWRSASRPRLDGEMPARAESPGWEWLVKIISDVGVVRASNRPRCRRADRRHQVSRSVPLFTSTIDSITCWSPCWEKSHPQKRRPFEPIGIGQGILEQGSDP